MNGRVLIVDDDSMIREVIRSMLEFHRFESSEVSNAADLHRMFKEGPQPDAVLLDLGLPDAEGLDLLPEIKRSWPETEVIVLTGRGSFDAAVEATKRGAFHFQAKPFETKALMLLIERAIEHKRLSGQASSLRQAVSTLSGSTPAVFQSPAMKAALRVIERVAPTDVSVLITGESGTGKEVVCDLIHSLSPRCGGPLIKVNC
ncbi:MAG: sigma-54-dependent Fis family transcriptional regulator [Verrucomicrobia bacterium]|nr:sigma-54-dependent Fis family transcriptional regulator [Verrucomicrobiota bacterium]